uniref:SHSP domain-containing protein n=1 Tax=Ditylenchus dipsaci TaxID=166011 RepID=A0A915D850_9BILA
MSLIPIEELFMPTQRPMYHYHYTPNLMASLLNDSFGQLQQLERQLGQMQTDSQVGGDDGSSYSFKCSVAGYRPEELNVDVEGEELVIQGKHQQQGNGQSIHRTFERRVTLPESVDKRSIQCNLDEQGRLQVRAHKKESEKQPKVNIPIGFKPSAGGEQQQQHLTSNGTTEGKKQEETVKKQ